MGTADGPSAEVVPAARVTGRAQRLSVRSSRRRRRRDRLPARLREQINLTESRTRSGSNLHLRLAIDYSSRDSILRAAGLVGDLHPSREAFRLAIAKATNAPLWTRDVDLLIRTGGEKRLSDFLLWECAYAEFVFTTSLWPDFTPRELGLAVKEFASRSRRYGALSPHERDAGPSLSPAAVGS